MEMQSVQPGFEWAKVMITVKTYPNPSEKYGETVCVAGVRLDQEQPTWIRLYPMKFRLVDYDKQFKKYEVIEIPVAQHNTDPRPESVRPDQDRLRSLGVIERKDNWAERRRRLGPLIGETTLCHLLRVNREGTYADRIASLGLIRPRDIKVTVRRGDPWDERQLANAIAAARPSLFDQDGLRELEPAPFRVGLRFSCEASNCPGHTASVIDWETGQAGRRWRREVGDERAMERLRSRYETDLGDDRDAYLYVGNQHQHRDTFSVLGIWHPKKEPAPLYDGDLFS